MTVKATFKAAFPEARRISEFIERDFGAEGAVVSLDEGADGLWSVDAYFEDGEAEAIAAVLRDRLGADGFGAAFGVEALPETNWVAAGLRALAPVSAGRFVVHGSHDRGEIGTGRIAIEIDANEAFGTGHHGTTRGCLVVLDRLIRARRYRRMLDLGAGTGVLAIALAKALRTPVLASDIDPIAARVARANAALNGVRNRVKVVAAPGVEHDAIRRGAPYDLVVANILAEPLCRLAPRLAPLLAKDCALVLSGLLPRQRERVVAAYGVQGVKLRTALIFDGWSVLVLGWGRERRPIQP